MAITVKVSLLTVLLLSLLSCLFGSAALYTKNLQPKFGTPVITKDGVTCKFSNNPSIALGYLSVAFLVASTMVGYLSLCYYKKKYVLSGRKVNTIYTTFAWILAGVAAANLLWDTIFQHIDHISHKMYNDLDYACPTPDIGKAFYFDTLFWGAINSFFSGICWGFALNDFLHEDNDVNNGSA